MNRSILEIELRVAVTQILVDLRYHPPGADSAVHLSGIAIPNIEETSLRSQLNDHHRYGGNLFQHLFADERLRKAYRRAREQSKVTASPLQFRLHIHGQDTALHNLRWETLEDPDDGPLCMDPQLWFSRYLSSAAPVSTADHRDLKALSVIANPNNLANFKLPALDLGLERRRILDGLTPIPTTFLAGDGAANLDALIEHLHEGVDVLTIAAHGTVVEGQSWLWLERPDGAVQRISAQMIAERLSALPRLPRLVLLIACRSAGQDDDRAVHSLAHVLAAEGVPAVLAMQGDVTFETMRRFLPVFFNELRKDGQLDRAMAKARAAVRERHDWWMPVLIMRLQSGRIFKPGFSDQRDLQKWPALMSHIERSKCTPILGPNLAQNFFGTRRDLARRWAEAHGFPMGRLFHDDLPRVAQFLSVRQDDGFLYADFQQQLTAQLQARYPALIQANMPFDQQLSTVAEWRREQEAGEPFRMLAELPLPVYISAMQDNLLEQALRAAGREPVVELCRWRRDLRDEPSIFDEEPDYRPSVERPLIYQLLGALDDDYTLLLTEDQYLDFLVSVGGDHQVIPPLIKRRLTDSALMFLGFYLDDWEFRLIFRAIMNHLGGGRRRRYSHVAVQVDGGDERIADPKIAQDYLESYFGNEQISIFWGDAEDFVVRLAQAWRERES